MNTVFPSVTLPQIVSSVDGIQIPAMVQPWSLYFTATGSGTEIWLGTYYPPQRVACFRRYKTGVTDQPIRVLCQRRFVEVNNDTDWLYPGHYGAMKAAMKAVQAESSTRPEAAQTLWATCYQKLNEQVHALRGGNRLEIPPSTFSYNQGFDNLMTLGLSLLLYCLF